MVLLDDRARYPRGVEKLLRSRYVDGQKAKEATPNTGRQVRGDSSAIELTTTPVASVLIH